MAGTHEDDEGLEFLGLEEAMHDAPPRQRRSTEEDDVVAESGLESVLDVPSWVEAIGIVIAGNLEARSRSSRPDDDRGRSGSRGGSSRDSQQRDGDQRGSGRGGR
ncbi:MAG: hypothetical protein EBZ59_09650 [Planctomycetia bacterium]|nr:hypothetical protein [Planctomycetia bacterium]